MFALNPITLDELLARGFARRSAGDTLDAHPTRVVGKFGLLLTMVPATAKRWEAHVRTCEGDSGTRIAELHSVFELALLLRLL